MNMKILFTEQRAQLEKTAALTQQEAKSELINAIEAEARHEAAKTVRVIETEAQETATKKGPEDPGSGLSALCRRLCPGKDGFSGEPAFR